MTGHALASLGDITPWEALLLAVKRAATWASYYESLIDRLEPGDHESILPGGAAYDTVVALERVNDKMARYSKMAIDAGVAQMMVMRAKNEGEQIARVLNQALGAGDLSADQETKIRTALAAALRALDEGPQPITAGLEESGDAGS